MARKLICQWRVSKAERSGLQVWFDPDTEVVRLYSLEPHREGGVADALEGDDQEDPGEPSSSDNELGLELPF